MASELRKDYILDRWVIVSTSRSKRPHISGEQRVKYEGMCYFCPGNENLTPPETFRVEEDGKWIIRCFPNKFPAVSLTDGKSIKNLLTSKPAYGYHEIAVETNEHDKDLGDLSVDHIVKVLEVYSKRINEIKKIKGIKYVLIFRNRGFEGGASLEHTHTQIAGLSIVPALIEKEAKASKKYRNKKHRCPFCDIWKKEIKSKRRIFDDKHTVAFAPFASRFPCEVWIMPKRHLRSLDEMKINEIRSFAKMLKDIIMRLNSKFGYPSYNFYFHIPPKEEDLHLHLELFPRMSKWAGFEFGSDIIINTTSPEIAAAFYRTGK